MDTEERSKIEKQSLTLRGELKTWEKEFAAANQGRKATRDEIKQNPSIAQKYKKYNKIRDILNGKQAKEPKSSSVAPSSPVREPRKRNAEPTHPETPSAKRHHHQTPRKREPQVDIFGNYDSPAVIRNLFDPNKKWVSPTPQKNGKYYGLFDKMTPDEKAGATPSGRGKDVVLSMQATPSRRNGTSNVQATPSRKTGNINWDELPFASTHKHSRTPTSSAKRHMLNKYISVTTPSKPRDGHGPDAARTPSSSVSKIHFPTPSYLKRDGGRAVGGGEEFLSPPMVRGPRKPLGRGLSSILADLRQMHSDAQDEELEALREVENEMERGISTSISSKPKPNFNQKKAGSAASKADAKPSVEVQAEIQVEDSQVNHLLSGFDDESKFDSDPETLNRDGNEKLGQDGKPLRVYKKKGQKRTTRRTKIRPTRPEKAIPHDIGKRLVSESPEPEGSPLRDIMANDDHDDEDEVLDTQTQGIMNYDDEQTDEGDDELCNVIPPDIEESSGIIPFDSTLKQKLNANDYDELDAEEDEDSGSDYTASSGGTRYRKTDQSEHLARVEMRKQAIKEGKSVGAKVRKGVRKVGAVVGMNFRKLKLRGKGAKAGGGGGKGRFGRRR